MTIPSYILQFPYRQMAALKLLLILLALFQLAIFLLNKESFAPAAADVKLRSTVVWFVVIPNLLSLLALANSAWFMLQKFFWIKLELCLALASLSFTSFATYGAVIMYYHNKLSSDQSWMTIIFKISNFAMLLLLLLSLRLTLRHGRNRVSNLFIKDWGAAEFSDAEVQQLESDF